MKMLFQLLLAVSLFSVKTSAADSDKQSVLQFRLVVENPTTNSEEIILSQNNSEEKFQVQKEILLDATAIKSAKVSIEKSFQSWKNDSGKWEVSTNMYRIDVDFTDKGGKKLEEVTSQHIGQRLAIFIDGKLVSAPTIDMPISGGKAQIAGSFSKKEVEDIVRKINAAVAR